MMPDYARLGPEMFTAKDLRRTIDNLEKRLNPLLAMEARVGVYFSKLSELESRVGVNARTVGVHRGVDFSVRGCTEVEATRRAVWEGFKDVGTHLKHVNTAFFNSYVLSELADPATAIPTTGASAVLAFTQYLPKMRFEQAKTWLGNLIESHSSQFGALQQHYRITPEPEIEKNLRARGFNSQYQLPSPSPVSPPASGRHGSASDAAALSNTTVMIRPPLPPRRPSIRAPSPDAASSSTTPSRPGPDHMGTVSNPTFRGKNKKTPRR